MPRKNTKYQDETESDENTDEEIVRDYNLYKREKPSSASLKHKCPVSSSVRNTSVQSESSILSASVRSPNSFRESRSSSDGYNSPHRNSPPTGSSGRLYPDFSPEHDQVLEGKNSSKLYQFQNFSFNELKMHTKINKHKGEIEKHKSPVYSYVTNTSVQSESSILSESDKSPNSSRGSRSSSDGYNSPNRNSPHTGSPSRLYPDFSPEPSNIPKANNRFKLYPDLNDSPNNLSKNSETLNESRENVSDTHNALRKQILHYNNSDEEIANDYNLRKREKPSSPLLKHQSPVSSSARNTSVQSESSILSESDKSPNSSRGYRSSSEGYNSPNRNSPYTGSPGRMYPDLPTEPNNVPKANNRSKLYPDLNDSPNISSKNLETLNGPRDDSSDSQEKLRKRNVNCNNASGEWRRENTINPKENANNNDDTFSSNSKLLIIFVLVLTILFYILTSSNTSTTSAHTHVSTYKSFINDIDTLEKMFPNQNKRFWYTFKASSRHILADPNSEYPSVILMASQTYNSHIATCIAKLITRKFESVSLSKLPDFTVADIGLLKTLSSGEQKKKLNEKLTTTFRQHKSVILDNLESLSPQAALLLHGYCDNDNAPYKDVMIVLILHVDPNQLKLDPDGTNSVEKYLHDLWAQGLHEDKVASLLSDLANNIVVVNAEDEDKVSEACAIL